MFSFFQFLAWKKTSALLPLFSLVFILSNLGYAEEISSQSLPKEFPDISIPEISLTGKELQKEIRDSLKRWKTVEPSEAQSAASELLGLYLALKNDATLTPTVKENLLRSLCQKLDRLSVLILKNSTAPKKTPESVKRAKRHELGQAPNGAPVPNFSVKNTAQNQTIQESGENLVDVIQQTIHPDSWDANGGTGQIQFWLPNGTLVIRQTEPIHQEIQGLLNQLRRAGS